MEKTGLAFKVLAFFTGLSGIKAYGLILGVLLACGFGVPIPEDITLIAAGILAGTGNINIYGAYIVGFVGVLAGDTILFFIGRKYGRRAFEFPIFKKIFTPELIKKAEKRIQDNDKFICFLARFLPGLRAPIYLTAGVMGVKPMNFFLMDGFAALISVPVWVFLGDWGGQKMKSGEITVDYILDKAGEFHIYIFIGIGVLLSVYILKKYLQKRKEQTA